MPQQLNFLDLPAQETSVWERVDAEHRALVIDALAQLIAKAALASQNPEATHD